MGAFGPPGPPKPPQPGAPNQLEKPPQAGAPNQLGQPPQPGAPNQPRQPITSKLRPARPLGAIHTESFENLPPAERQKAEIAQDNLNGQIQTGFEPRFVALEKAADNLQMTLNDRHEVEFTGMSKKTFIDLVGEKAADQIIDKTKDKMLDVLLGEQGARVLGFLGMLGTLDKIRKDIHTDRMMNSNSVEAKNWRSQQALNFVTEMSAQAELKAEGGQGNPYERQLSLVRQYNSFYQAQMEFRKYLNLNERLNPTRSPNLDQPTVRPAR